MNETLFPIKKLMSAQTIGTYPIKIPMKAIYPFKPYRIKIRPTITLNDKPTAWWITILPESRGGEYLKMKECLSIKDIRHDSDKITRVRSGAIVVVKRTCDGKIQSSARIISVESRGQYKALDIHSNEVFMVSKEQIIKPHYEEGGSIREMKHIAKGKQITPEKSGQLIKKYNDIVKDIVYQYAQNFKIYAPGVEGIEKDDLVQEVWLKIFKSIQNYDEQKGNEVPYIRRLTEDAILSALKEKTVWEILYIPRAVKRNARKLKSYVRECLTKGEELTHQDMVDYAIKDLKVNKTERVEEIIELMEADIVPIEQNYDPDGDSFLTLMGSLTDKSDIPEKIAEEKNVSEHVANIIDESLSCEQADLIKKRFGIESDNKCSIKQIAEMYGITRYLFKVKYRKAMKTLCQNKELRELFNQRIQNN